MKPLDIKEFKDPEVIPLQNGLEANRVFLSNVKDFEGKLSNSYYSLKLPISGIEHYTVSKRTYDIDNDSYLITNANQDIEAYVKSENEVVGICIGFTKNYLLDLAGSMVQTLEMSLDTPFNVNGNINFITKKNKIQTDKLSLAIKMIKQDVIQNKIIDNYDESQFYMSLGEMLIEKQVEIFSDINKLPNAKFSTREEIYRRVCLMNDFIHENYRNSITLDQLSHISYLSKFHAIRCYQKINNISPYQKIQMLRLEDAKQLIKKGMSIKNIANETNFPDHRALSKSFKKHYNMTPSQYRAMHS